MSDDKPARHNDEGAPLLPGGEPELAGTGPEGAYPDGSPQPGEPVVPATDNDGDEDEA